MELNKPTITPLSLWSIFFVFLFLPVVFCRPAFPQPEARPVVLKGRVLDPQGNPLPGASIEIFAHTSRGRGQLIGRTVSGNQGLFTVNVPQAGEFEIKAEASGLRMVSRIITVGGDTSAASSSIEIRLNDLSSRPESVTVTADLMEGDVMSPDPAEKVFATADLLDANPGRPGAPVSIPGYPIETASSGIKAPQYFAPGVAGDHGEPIAQYIQVGSYLVPNNLSANAHGNGYADPNIYIASVIESVQVDGGAYNVREGNHALNLAAIYGLRPRLDPFITLTGDYRDITATAGMNLSANAWLALEGSFGNGFLDRLEHRKQIKLNGGRVIRAGDHTLTMFGIAYLGYGYVAGLRPMYGFNSIDAAAGWQEYPDTIDPRQKDQTHTALAAVNDVWKLSEHQELQLSGFFRSYNLSLFSDFGLGLIRQSEFRTATGASADYVNKITPHFTLLAGTDYNREAPRRDDLDHYNFYNPAAPSFYGPFVKIDGNNVTISDVAPYVAGQGDLSKYVHYYVGWRHDEIWIDNQDLVAAQDSTYRLAALDLPKATISILPGSSRYAPLISFSFGKSFFTEDPREGLGAGSGGAPAYVSPVETARSYQVVATKTVHKTDLKLTLGHETQSNEYGKIDPDQGIQEPLGPGRIRYVGATLRQAFSAGSLQVTFEQADARLVGVPVSSITPEAPRLIGDVLGTYQKLPFRLQAKGEFEYVGRKVVGTSCDVSQPLSGGTGYCLGVPNKEFRLALARPFLDGRISVGLNTMIASGWTGQTTENFAAASVYGPGRVGLVNGVVPADPVSEVVGVRLPSYASINITYRFGHKPVP